MIFLLTNTYLPHNHLEYNKKSKSYEMDYYESFKKKIYF